MNYLAHVFLSGNESKMMVGNLIGDMIRNKEVVLLPAEMVLGVQLHRAIDSYTDVHPEVHQINAIFRPTQRKYAPVVSDIMMDYILANHWSHFCKIDFEDWCVDAYDRIDDYYQDLPINVRKRLASMVNGKWLHGYRSEEGIKYTFSRLTRRVRFANQFEKAFDVYASHHESIDQHFLAFFNDIMAYVEEWKRINLQNVVKG